MSNRIYFRRAGKVIVEGYTDVEANFSEVASLDANLRKLGYALDNTLAMRLLDAPVAEIKAIHDTLIREAKEIKGVRRYSPMYPNFPRQVMEASEAELYINAIFHYFGDAVGLRIMPKYDAKARPELNFDEKKVTLVRLGSNEDFLDLLVNLFNSKSAFSPTDKADIADLDAATFTHALNLASRWDFPNRENKATLFAMGLDAGVITQTFVGTYLTTATDVLRLAVALSGGDVSLAENTRFRSFKRSERRFLLASLRNAGTTENLMEDMVRHASAWKRLGERLHPGEHGMADLFKAVRDNGAVVTFNSRVEAAIAKGNAIEAANLLVNRPGEFARRLDKVLRMTDNTIEGMAIVQKFAGVAEKVAPTVLLQARNNLVTREGRNVRAFFPKGSVAKMQSKIDQRGGIRMIVLNAAVNNIEVALVKQFKGRGSLGKVFVDPALKGVAVPFALRNASKSVKTLGRGSRLPLGEDTNVVRFFIWWKDAEGGTHWNNRVDIDLSAVMFDKDFNGAGYITYYNLRENGAVHSGDITSAPNGASEFIDIDLDVLRRRGVRYVAMTLHSYAGQDYAELPECFAGFMERRDLDSGEVYDPRTVTNKADITAKSKGATPFIFDLETGEAIWVDLSMQVSDRYANVANSKGQITSVVEAMTTLTPPNLYDLFCFHAAARGDFVFSRDEADTVFALDGDVTPFDTELILDKYL